MTVNLPANVEGIGAGLDKIEQALTKYGLKLYRISTVDTINVETIEDMLSNNMIKVI